MDEKKNIKIILIAVAVLAIGFFIYKQYKKKQQSVTETPTVNLLETAQKSSSTPIKTATQTTPQVSTANQVPLKSITVVSGKTVFPGYWVYPLSSNVNVRKEPNTSASILTVVKSTAQIGTTTGEIKQQVDGVWIKVKTMSGAMGWVRSDIIKIVVPKK